MKKFILILFFTFAFCLLPFHLKAQWVQQTVPVSKPITGIKFIDTLRGWACTSLGMGGANYAYILHTTNSGTNWIVQDSTFNADFSAINVIDSNIIYAGGYDFTTNTANLNKTTNGGLTWTVIPTPTNMSIDDMQFINNDSGWVCAGNVGADIRTTTDGGLSWTVRTNGISAQTQRIFFLNYNTGFCGANNFLYKTTNAGINWILNGNLGNTVESIFFLNANTGWLGTYTPFYTSNGGTNWIVQSLPPQGNGNIYDIYFLNNLTGYAGTGLNTIFKTTNAGLNWGYQIDTGGSYRISFIDSVHGWTCSLGSRIDYTSNGGGNIVNVKQISFEVPNKFYLFQNYPNPFNPNTKIKFQISKSGFVTLKVLDILGRELKTLLNQRMNTGTYETEFNANSFSSGIYFYKLIVDGNTVDTKKMILLK